jgi:hypothetical protein
MADVAVFPVSRRSQRIGSRASNLSGLFVLPAMINARLGRFRLQPYCKGQYNRSEGRPTRMIVSVNTLLRKIEDLRRAAVSARALAEHFDGEERRSILQLADDWDSQAAQEETRLVQLSAEAEEN